MIFAVLPAQPLTIIASAVTPAVMISATAILISGIGSKHANLADRLRALTAEYRDTGTSDQRRRVIHLQSVLFIRRLHLITSAHMLLYGATGAFVAMVFAITVATLSREWERLLFACFLIGVSLLLAGVLFEILELRLANKTLELETRDAFTPE